MEWLRLLLAQQMGVPDIPLDIWMQLEWTLMLAAFVGICLSACLAVTSRRG